VIFEHLFVPVSYLFALTLLYDSTGSAEVDSLARSGMRVRWGFTEAKLLKFGNLICN
jgi:hypothetical protein